MKNTSSLDDEIRRRIDALLHDISSLVKSSALESVRTALGDAQAPSMRVASVSAAPARASRVRSKGGKRTSEQVNQTAATILSHVQGNSGQRLEQIAKAMSLPTNAMKLPIQKLMASGAVHTEGVKRGTRYFAGAAAAGARRKGKARKA